jgi:hypothetical protein
MDDIDRLERDLDPPTPQEPIRIKSWWLSVKWEDGRIEDIALPSEFRQAGKDIENFLDEVEYEYNRDILEHQAQKYGDPDGDY